MPGNRIRLSLAFALGCLTLVGCATVPPSERDPRDPWQRMNRATWRFDYGFYTDVAEPVVKTYVRVTPHPIQAGISNFFHNLTYPEVIVNDLLQGQVADFGKDTVRFVIDSTFGIGGLLDPATGMGLVRHDRDFGQTFGKWGIPTGPYLVLPFLGPSDVRDAIGLVPAEYADPLHYVQNTGADYGTRAVGTLNTGAHLLPIFRLDQRAFDHYAFARNTYLERRRFMVRGPRTSPGGAEQELKELENSAGN